MTGNTTGSSTKKHGPNPAQKINHSLKETPWNWMLQKKKGFKKKLVTFAGNWVI